jgi:hypothetical protein
MIGSVRSSIKEVGVFSRCRDLADLFEGPLNLRQFISDNIGPGRFHGLKAFQRLERLERPASPCGSGVFEAFVSQAEDVEPGFIAVEFLIHISSRTRWFSCYPVRERT